MEIKHTERGFARAEFTDRYGAECSIQDSSLADEAAIWLGVNTVIPKVLASQAIAMGRSDVANGETTGWVNWPIPDCALTSGRMHLTQAQVAALLPMLHHFVKHGQLPEPKGKDGAK